MKILMANKFHNIKLESEKYYFYLTYLLKKNGHQVTFFSMKGEKIIEGVV